METVRTRNRIPRTVKEMDVDNMEILQVLMVATVENMMDKVMAEVRVVPRNLLTTRRRTMKLLTSRLLPKQRRRRRNVDRSSERRFSRSSKTLQKLLTSQRGLLRTLLTDL